jgi:hypothetical protein
VVGLAIDIDGEMADWMIYGANGYTGELIAREAARQGLRPIRDNHGGNRVKGAIRLCHTASACYNSCCNFAPIDPLHQSIVTRDLKVAICSAHAIAQPAFRVDVLPMSNPVLIEGSKLLHATIFPSSETVPHTAVRLRFMRRPIAHRCIGQRRLNRRADVTNRALSQRRR